MPDGFGRIGILPTLSDFAGEVIHINGGRMDVSHNMPVAGILHKTKDYRRGFRKGND